ncbi:MAG: macro domain-containing protein [Candidatus Acidiferrales bacterium]
MSSLLDLWRGIRRHPWKTLGYIFTSFSVIFTLARGITFFIPAIKIEGPVPLFAAVTISIAFGLQKVWKPSRVEITVANCNTTIEILFGDLFKQDGIRVISVSEFFDSKLGMPVSDKSVHGIFLQKCFGGHPEAFDKQVEEQLKHVEYQPVDKSDGKCKCYPIGATALLTANDDRYILIAFAKADPVTCKAYSDVKIMWDSLHWLWQRVRIESGGYAVNLPLVGSGLSGLGLPTRDLLNLIILSAITETKAKEITQRIRIVLHRDRFDHVDLRDVRQHWKE